MALRRAQRLRGQPRRGGGAEQLRASRCTAPRAWCAGTSGARASCRSRPATQYAGQPTSTVFSEPGDGEYAAFQPGAGIAMGYDDTKVVEAMNFVRAVAGEAAAGRHPGRRGRQRDASWTRWWRRTGPESGWSCHDCDQAGDAGFAVDDRDRSCRPRRIGVIGCGRIGRMHASLLAREVPGFVVAAVADAVPAAAEGVSAATGAPVLIDRGAARLRRRRHRRHLLEHRHPCRPGRRRGRRPARRSSARSRSASTWPRSTARWPPSRRPGSRS